MSLKKQEPGALLLGKTEEKLFALEKDLSGLSFVFFGFSIVRAARVSAHVSSHVCVCVSVCLAVVVRPPC
jgi:hypothetical protein